MIDPLILNDYEKWLYRLANDMLWTTSAARNILSVDDLVQEGRVAMWRALQKFDPDRGLVGSHLKNAARKRMLDIVMGKKPTFGTEGNRGRVKVPEAAYMPLPEPGSPYEPVAGPMVAPETSQALTEALAAMSPKAREYVESVFWEGARLRRDRKAWLEAEATVREYVAA